MGKYNPRTANPRSNPNLSNVTFNVSDDILDALNYGISRGWWVSLSEGVRVVMNRSLNLVFQEKLAMEREIIDKVETKLDPEKRYVNLPGRGYIEILGEA